MEGNKEGEQGVQEAGPSYHAATQDTDGIREQRIYAQLQTWWAQATPDERVWLDVDLRIRYPRIWGTDPDLTVTTATSPPPD